MRVVIDRQVDQSIHDFYWASMWLHPTLDYNTVYAKVNRLYDAMESLQHTYSIYPEARLKQSWIELGYKELIVEDFHIAFRIETDMDGEQYIAIYDAVHSLLYHN